MADDDLRQSPITVLINVLNQARAAVPAVDYALGLVGVAAAGGIISIILGSPRAAIFFVVFVFIGMILLFVFSQLVRTKSSSAKLAATFLLWFVVITFAAGVLLVISAVAFRQPPGMVQFLFPYTGPSRAELAEIIYRRVGASEEIDAINKLTGMAKQDASEIEPVVSAVRSLLDHDEVSERESRTAAIAALREITKDDFKSVITDQFENADLEKADFSNLDLSGVSFRGAFMLFANFTKTKLAGSDFSGALVRGSSFKQADMAGTDMTDVDWFNADGWDKDQLFSARPGTLMRCPEYDESRKEFLRYIDKNYGIDFKDYPKSHQEHLRELWRSYSSPGGLCEMVAHQ